MSAEVNRMVSVLLTLVQDTELSHYWTPQDERHLRSRCEAEGISYLTTELPKLAKALHKSFTTGVMCGVEGFRSVRGRAYPLFMRKAWETLLESDGCYLSALGRTECLKPELTCGSNFLHIESAQELAGAVKAIRQVSLMFYKTKLPYSDEQVKNVIDSFIGAERDLASLDLTAESTLADHKAGLTPIEVLGHHGSSSISVDSLLTRASRYVKRLLYGFSPYDIRPRHGSGASACKTKPWQRYSMPRYIPKLDKVYPYHEWFFLSQGVDLRESELIDNLELCEEPMARVVFVPKDSRGPRLISTEPREFMYIQQGLMDQLYNAIGSFPMVKAQLDCRDQTRNQRLARWGSATGSVATLDLKEASDRVSLDLVRRLFPSEWVKCLEACRSTATRLPDGRVVPFRKFAPMGSAVCFPVEAICFWAIAHAATMLSDKSIDNVFSNAPLGLEFNQLSVFGDDIIVPTDHVEYVIGALEAVGLKVNRDKSYTSGPFRESCGADFLLGEDVSYVKCREVPVASGSRNTMDRARFRTADWFNNLIMRYGTYVLADPLHALFREWYGEVVVSTRVIIPDVDDDERDFVTSNVPSRGLVLLGHIRQVPAAWELQPLDFTFGEKPRRKVSRRKKRIPAFSMRMNPDLHRLEVYTLVELPVIQKIDIDDWSHLLRVLLKGSGTLEASKWTLAKRCSYKYGWIAV
jgi:hypothetical protein